MDLLQVHLPSKRAARFRLLTPTEHDEILLKAATLAGPSGSVAAIRTSQVRESLKAMLHSCTRKLVESLEEAARLEKSEWVELNAQVLTIPGDFQYDRAFTAKDDMVLSHLYTRYHELTKDEAEAIVGKVQTVSVG